jgi:hypothetical protein
LVVRVQGGVAVQHGPRNEPPPSEDDLDLDREIEYAFDTDETMGMLLPAGDVE